MTQLDKAIFRAYDIRGISGEQITEHAAYLIACAFAKLMREHGQSTLSVARDARLSGETLEKALIDGFIASGINVIELGILPTPVLYFATCHNGCSNGVIVTASHNPGEYNGFKFVLQQKPLLPEQIANLYHTILHAPLLPAETPGVLTHQPIRDDYIQTIATQVQLKRPLKIVVDAGNGVAGEIAPRLYRRLGCEVIEMYCDLDGRFPNHHPDPSRPENLAALKAKVLETKADVGLAFDGDGDRIGIITNQGEIIWPDRLLMMLSQDVLRTNPGAKILFDVKCSSHLPRLIKAHGGEPIMWRTGHSFIKIKIKESHAALAGEMSGHIFFNDRWFGFDDGLYTGARFLEVLSQADEDAHTLFAAIPNSINTPEINIPISDTEKFNLLDQLTNSAKILGVSLILIDGIRFEFADGWALIRASNTSPVLVLRFEADTKEALTRIQHTVKQLLLDVKKDLAVPF